MDNNSVIPKLVQVYQGVIHFVSKVQDFVHYKDITSTSKRVTPCGSNSCDRYIGYRREIVVKPLYLTLLACEENWSAVCSRITCVCLSVKFTTSFYSKMHSRDMAVIGCFEPLDRPSGWSPWARLDRMNFPLRGAQYLRLKIYVQFYLISSFIFIHVGRIS